jgi:hypothetical protein
MKPEYKPIPGLTEQQARDLQHHEFVRDLVEKVKDPRFIKQEDVFDIISYAEDIKQQLDAEKASVEYWTKRIRQEKNHE